MMETIKDIYKIGYGPSSSHTMGPRYAAERFYKDFGDAASFRVALYGSLAATGKGHLTDLAIIKVLGDRLKPIEWHPEIIKPFHANAMTMWAYDSSGKEIATRTIYSVGGGKVITEGEGEESSKAIYHLTSMSAILAYLHKTGLTFWEYVEECEGTSIWDYLAEVWEVMKEAVERGITAEGLIPGGLKLQRKAAAYLVKSGSYKGSLKRRSALYAHALAVSEENACGGKIVTAPTCGSCGVLPGVLYGRALAHNFSDMKIYRALATAGLVGNLVKCNASISGAQVGCQGEVGTACAMASAAAAQLFGGTPRQIEYAAEMGLEHHLGLTCDPVCGLVQIPCIERNAFAASRALDANTYALLSDGTHNIGFDVIVETMNRTGNDLPSIYKETAAGGIAQMIGVNNF